jgi:hypothetical protein
MQRQKNIQLLCSLITIVVVTILVFVFAGSRNASSVDKDLFRIDNLDKIDEIILEARNGKTQLKYNGTKWKVNGNYDADRKMIDVLFATLKQTIAKRPVASILQDSIQKEISKNGIKISCFENGSLSKEIWVAGNLQKTETYFETSGGKAHLVTIPGYRVFIASIFELSVNEWRDKHVFRFNWQNIKSLEATFPSDPKQNFKASFNKNFFSIEGIATDTTKLDQFMDALLRLQSEKILDSIEAKKIEQKVPEKTMMSISIQDVASRTYPLTIFTPDGETKLIVGKINDEVVLLNPLALRDIYKKRNYFIQH